MGPQVAAVTRAAAAKLWAVGRAGQLTPPPDPRGYKGPKGSCSQVWGVGYVNHDEAS